ncbi:MAG: hypothetical protein AB8G99_06185 [Planctomycetaceae bacterium]
MGRMVMYGALVIGSFAIAAGGSWFLNQKEEDKTEQAEGDGEDENAVQQLGDETTDGIPQELPSAVPPKAMSAEHLYRMGEVMKTRVAAIERRESELENEERRLKLVLMDIDAEQRETDGFLTQVRGTLDTTTQILQEIQTIQSQPVPEKPKDEEKDENTGLKQPSENEMKNYKRQAAIFQGMDPAKAATQLTKMANEGDVDKVVWIVSKFEERKAAKMLEVMPDESLAIQIAKRSLEIRHPEKKKKR